MQHVSKHRLFASTKRIDVPIEQYAKTSNVSVNTFRRIFGKRFGMSPIKYRNLMRMDRARALLYEGSFIFHNSFLSCIDILFYI